MAFDGEVTAGYAQSGLSCNDGVGLSTRRRDGQAMAGGGRPTVFLAHGL